MKIIISPFPTFPQCLVPENTEPTTWTYRVWLSDLDRSFPVDLLHRRKNDPRLWADRNRRKSNIVPSDQLLRRRYVFPITFLPLNRCRPSSHRVPLICVYPKIAKWYQNSVIYSLREEYLIICFSFCLNCLIEYTYS